MKSTTRGGIAKLLPAKRLLKLNLKHLGKGLKWAKAGDIPELTAHVAEIKCSFDDYTSQVCSNISDPSLRRDLIDELATKLEQCCSSHETAIIGKQCLKCNFAYHERLYSLILFIENATSAPY